MKNFLYPQSYFEINQPDSNFAQEYQIAKTCGHNVFLFDDNDVSTVPICFHSSKKEEIILRGWMMNSEKYNDFYRALVEKNWSPISTTKQYLNCHHFPNAYSKISKYSPFTYSYDSFIPAEIVKKLLDTDLNLKKLVVKDFVKSVKDIKSSTTIIDCNMSIEEIRNTLYKFLEKRGNLFEKGFVFKEYVDLLRDSNGETNEWRVFVYKDTIIDNSENSNFNEEKPECPNIELVFSVMNDMKGLSSFYTIDFAQKTDGSFIVIECGDGQVSGPALKTDLISFYNHFFNKI